MTRPLTLDEAWKEAEAALPDGWQLGSMVAAVAFRDGTAETRGWTAGAYDGRGIPVRDNLAAYAPDLAAALEGLAGKLREVRGRGAA